MTLKRIAAAAAITTGLGLAGVGAASIAEAQPVAPLPDYHWCPGQWFDPAWGNNWDGGRCHDDGFFDGEPRDRWPLARSTDWPGTVVAGITARLGQPRAPAGITTAPNGWDNHGPGGHDGWHN